VALDDPASVIAGDHLYVTGGLNGSVRNGFLHIVGGGSSESTVRDDVFYAPINADGTLGAWQTATEKLPQVRLDHTTVVSGGRAYVIGGVNGSFVAQSTVYSAPLNADGSTGAWVGETALPAAREDVSTAEHGGYVYVFAGKGAWAVTTTYSARLP